jgi:peptidyl-prolyl cis-trans isomerase D
MLQSLRDKTSGWIAPAILILLIIPFAFFGVENYFQQNVATHVAKVGDQEIGQDEFRARFEEFRGQMRQAMGENFDAREFESAENKRRVLDRMIDEELLRQASERLGVTVSPAQMQKEIARIPAFQSEGRFDPDTYRLVLTSQGMTPRGFEERVRKEMLLQALPTQLVATGFVTGEYVSRYLALRDQTRSFSWVELPTPAAESIGEITDADVQAWFDGHASDYVSPETVALEYVEIDAAKVEVPTTVDEATLRERYEDQKARYIEAEQRLASHILVKVAADADADAVKAAQAKAADLVAKARAAGADFAALAKENSDDPGSKNTGGDLGWVEKGIFEPAFETALFAMQANTISDPVKTAEGWHVIQLREIKPETGKPFEAVRAELEKEYLDGERERIVSDLAGKLVDVIYRDPSTLATASSELNLPIQKTEAFTRAGGTGIAANPKVVDAAFSDAALNDGQASDPIEIAPGHQVVVRVAEHVPAAPRKLEDVRKAVRAAIVADRLGKAAKAQADAALAELKGGKTLDAYATEHKLEVKTADAVGRTAATVNAAVLQQVFQLPHPAEGKPTLGLADLSADRYALMALSAVQDGDPAKTEAEARTAMLEQLSQALGGAEANAFVQALRKNTPIEVVEERM